MRSIEGASKLTPRIGREGGGEERREGGREGEDDDRGGSGRGE